MMGDWKGTNKILIHFNMDFDKTEKAFSLIAIDFAIGDIYVD